MDRQNRPGGKAGTFGVASAQSESIARRERLKALAAEIWDVRKDPYAARNYVGQIECKLCLTVHPNEGNYMAHTQGKRHTENLAKRAAMEQRERAGMLVPTTAPMAVPGAAPVRRAVKIGRPGYRVLKAREPATGGRVLVVEVSVPHIESGSQPRHRILSAFELRARPGALGALGTGALPDKDVQYLLIAAAPYETIGFGIPSGPLDKGEGRLWSHWDEATHTFTVRVTYKPTE